MENTGADKLPLWPSHSTIYLKQVLTNLYDLTAFYTRVTSVNLSAQYAFANGCCYLPSTCKIYMNDIKIIAQIQVITITRRRNKVHL